jgi:hypothetical protein
MLFKLFKIYTSKLITLSQTLLHGFWSAVAEKASLELAKEGKRWVLKKA